MRYSLQFDFSDFNRKLIIEHKKLLREAFNKQIPFLTKTVKKEVVSTIKASTEYKSLINARGLLRRQLGLGEQGGDAEGILNPVSAMAIILDLITEDILVTVSDKKEGTDFIIGVNIQLLTDINKLTSSDAARYISINARGEMHEIPWLEWLLTAGQSSVVMGYHVVYKESAASRTGYAVMGKGGSFSMESTYAGTKNNNFIVNSIKKFQEEKLSGLIDEFLIKAVG